MTKKPLQPRKTPQKKADHYIREWRKHRGLSQEKLAERIEKTHGFISQIERGISNPSVETLEALAYALSCTSHELRHVNPLKEGKVVNFLDIIRQASPSEQDRILGYAESLIKKA